MSGDTAVRRGWIQEWDPEDRAFWERTGRRTANRNLVFSVLSEHIGFSIWSLWSVMVLFMGPKYGIDPAGKFFLVAMPTLVGAFVRIPYTVAVARFGGRKLDGGLGAAPAAARTGRRVRDGAGDLLHHLHGGRRAHRARRGELRLLDDQHQRLLPAAPQGLGARAERRRRQHRGCR
ncbi:hypothetical protein GCM10020229_76880 [Kitasatospora albolonga]